MAENLTQGVGEPKIWWLEVVYSNRFVVKVLTPFSEAFLQRKNPVIYHMERSL